MQALKPGPPEHGEFAGRYLDPFGEPHPGHAPHSAATKALFLKARPVYYSQITGCLHFSRFIDYDTFCFILKLSELLV
ncbi:hypothetical protein LJK88_03015 [Paenibacillus sp. P26]|nr:hypothetical protein LJK88_03015 [Paenibacillus sp. P26]UUZ90880.1 hypothetical protein LJK87_34465 [Paenibacillus sp. P25]